VKTNDFIESEFVFPCSTARPQRSNLLRGGDRKSVYKGGKSGKL
jgi:hypothetical protein